MPDDANAFQTALALILGRDPDLIGIVALSLKVSLSAVMIAALIALPLGAALALWRFPGRGGLVVVLNALMGLPPVVAGLAVYLLLSRAGPLGELGLLFTPGAMVIAQVILVLPIIAALTRQQVEELHVDYREQLTSMGVSRARRIPTLLWDARFGLATVMLAGFGRASAEVGAVMIVGGNIDGVTRVMTTAIVLETSKGDLPLALGLGMVLLGLVALVNAAAHLVGESARRRLG
ncbi:ABC transporter permease [Halomonas aquatica]|uniref:ABC transporter permease n=1 Tax=Halomonas aquatica TaxID=3151123 RepID=A0ABV1NGH3_9GAMM